MLANCSFRSLQFLDNLTLHFHHQVVIGDEVHELDWRLKFCLSVCLWVYFQYLDDFFRLGVLLLFLGVALPLLVVTVGLVFFCTSPMRLLVQWLIGKQLLWLGFVEFAPWALPVCEVEGEAILGGGDFLEWVVLQAVLLLCTHKLALSVDQPALARNLQFLEGIRCIIRLIFFTSFFLRTSFKLRNMFSIATVIKMPIICTLILVLKFFLFASFDFVLGIEVTYTVIIVEKGSISRVGRGFLFEFELFRMGLLARGRGLEKFDVFGGGLLELFFIFGRVGCWLKPLQLLCRMGTWAALLHRPSHSFSYRNDKIIIKVTPSLPTSLQTYH